MSNVEVLIVDDQPFARYGLRVLLRDFAGVRLVAEAGTEQEASQRFDESRPGLVIAVISSANSLDGLRFCRHVKEQSQDIPIIVLSADASPSIVAAALNAGVDSFVHKSVSCNQLIDAIERTRSGRRVWVVDGSPAHPVVEARAVSRIGLTRREEEVLALVLARRSNEEIADDLHLAVQTVKNYVSRALRKLGCSSRRELFRSLELNKCGSIVPFPRAPAVQASVSSSSSVS